MTNNKFQHVNLAVTSKEGEVMFYETLDHESGSLYKNHKNIIYDRTRSYKVKTVTILGLLKYLDLQSVDFIKFDLEGAEYLIFNTINISELKIFRQIYIEFHHHAIQRYNQNDTKKIVYRIRNGGFKVFSLDDHNFLFYR
jgi:FkbM family methyltransferase